MSNEVSVLTDGELVSRLGGLAHSEREATVALIVHLAEFDARRLYEPAGFSSTFRYCLKVLRLSEDAAFNRIEAARLGRRLPAVLEMLVEGTLSPTTARMLAKHLTNENQQELLAAAAGRSKQEVEELLARRFPQPDVPSRVRPLGPAAAAPGTAGPLPIEHRPAPAAISASPAPTAEPASGSMTAVSGSPMPSRAPGAERYEIRFTARAETREKLRTAQTLLAHAVPDGDLGEVFDRALTLLIAELERRKLAATDRPRAGVRQAPDSRHVPAHVRRVVWARDGWGCAFVAADGSRCQERRFLELHHLRPYGVGGLTTVDNLQLRCRAHNRHEADEFYGPARRYAAGQPVETAAARQHHRGRAPVPERANRAGGSATVKPAAAE